MMPATAAMPQWYTCGRAKKNTATPALTSSAVAAKECFLAKSRYDMGLRIAHGERR